VIIVYLLAAYGAIDLFCEAIGAVRRIEQRKSRA
jgi:hypothetical protein